LRVAFNTIPKDVQIAIEQRTGPLDSNEIRLLRHLVDMVDAAGAANAADSDTVLGWLEGDLRRGWLCLSTSLTDHSYLSGKSLRQREHTRDANYSNNNKAADHGERIFVDAPHTAPHRDIAVGPTRL
jgi:hypothetical protein